MDSLNLKDEEGSQDITPALSQKFETELSEEMSPVVDISDFSAMAEMLPGPDVVTVDRQTKLKQALIVQMEMQKHLHHQLEV